MEKVISGDIWLNPLPHFFMLPSSSDQYDV